MKRVILLVMLLFVLAVSNAFAAATYYLSPAGNNSWAGNSETGPWKTFAYAFGRMSAGDELILIDGTYSETVGTGYINWNDGSAPNSGQPPSGTSLANVTVVRAKNPGSVVINGGSREGLFLGRSARKDSYIKIQGIRFEGGGTLYNTSYITIKDCGFHSARLSADGVFGIGTNDHANGNSYNLIEDCWIWGKERIIASNYRANNNIWRRVVIRGDGCSTMTGSGNPNVGFTVYDSSNNSIQNMVVIDRILEGGSPYAAFATAQHTDGSNYLGPNEWLGCIALKNEDGGFNFEADNANTNTHTLRNIVAWDCGEDNVNVGAQASNMTLENVTAGKSGIGADGIRVAPGVTSGTIHNLISYQAGRYGVNSAVTPTYCDVYNAADSAYNQTTCTTGARTSSPLNDGTPQSLKYLVRIEAGSALKGTGYGGADYGANVVKKYGVDGSRYGDSGYNTLGTTNLWPWLNEDRIKIDMAASSIRGFCADGRTLTKYIWEYLGNTIPADIYAGGGGGGDVTPPAAITNLSVSNQSDTSVTLTWTSPGNDGNSGTATSYDIRYSLAAINDSNFTSATQVSGVPVPLTAGTVQSVTVSGLQTGSLYYFAMKTSDAIPNTSAISNTVSATPRDSTPPAAVANLAAVTGSGDGQIVVNWTAPGDDGTAGRATLYDLRYSTANIISSNWDSASAVQSLAVPKVAGSGESVTVSGLLPGILYYFALKTSDESGNISSLSNVPSARSYNPVLPDTTAPAAITGMSAASGASNGTAVLNWIATGDDGAAGTATSYEIRYSRNAINSTNWSYATKYTRTTLPVPKISGQREKFIITGLTAGRSYYFAIKAKDNVGLFSAISNVPTAVAYNSATDTILPGTIADLAVANTSGNEVTLTWTAPGGDGQTGTCASYEIRYSTSPVSDTNFSSANFLVALAPQSVPVPNSAGFTETTTINNLSSAQSYYFGIKSYDGAGRISALSNVASIIIVVIDTIAPAAVADLAASPGEAMGSIIIGWTAPGNDGSTGQASSYTIKYATFTISDTNWNEAVPLATAPIPDMAGIYQTAVISDLNIGTQYYVAMKAADLSGNISAISNIAEVMPKTSIPPGNITDLASSPGTNDGDIILSWTAPTAGDGSQISSYEIKYSTSYIFEVNLLMIAADNQIEWSSASDYPIKPTPAAPGEIQTFICTGLKPNESYYFAVKSYDAEGNASVISNVSQSLAGNTDFTAPAKITDLQSEKGSGADEVILTWTASGDDGLVGTAASYTIKYASASISDTNWDLSSVASNTLVPKSAGNKESFTVTNLLPNHQYFFAIKIVDEVGNVSDVSNSPEIKNEPISDLDKVRSSPNPWKKASGGMIAISQLTPGAKVKIFNLAGELVRELEEQNGVVSWDAKNEDGQEVASGIYIYYAWDDEGHEKTGKMAILK